MNIYEQILKEMVGAGALITTYTADPEFGVTVYLSLTKKGNDCKIDKVLQSFEALQSGTGRRSSSFSLRIKADEWAEEGEEYQSLPEDRDFVQSYWERVHVIYLEEGKTLYPEIITKVLEMEGLNDPSLFIEWGIYPPSFWTTDPDNNNYLGNKVVLVLDQGDTVGFRAHKLLLARKLGVKYIVIDRQIVNCPDDNDQDWLAFHGQVNGFDGVLQEAYRQEALTQRYESLVKSICEFRGWTRFGDDYPSLSEKRFSEEMLSVTPHYSGATGSLVDIDENHDIFLVCEDEKIVKVEPSVDIVHNEAHTDSISSSDEDADGETVGEALRDIEVEKLQYIVFCDSGYEIRDHCSEGGNDITIVPLSERDKERISLWVKTQREMAAVSDGAPKSHHGRY